MFEKPTSIKVLVCGGTRYTDKSALYAYLDALHAGTPISLLINGGARGADLLASKWARENGIALEIFKRNQYQHGTDAFFELNDAMLEEARPDLVVAFPGGDVTQDLVARARTRKIAVRTV